MSSDLYAFDASFFSDPLSPFTDSSIDIFQTFPFRNHHNNHPILENPVDETNFLNQIAPTLLSSSLPSHQLENCPNSGTQFPNFSSLEVKTEDSSLSPYTYQSFGADNVAKIIQRSFSSHSSDGNPNFWLKSQFDSLMESPYFHSQVMSSPENSFSTGQMRRVFSTGDLLKIKTTQTNYIEEANFKVGRYSAEEKKQRIHRYRAKRTQRNFNKTIKYSCRKTLADNRPRIRGRFARNDETSIPKAAMFNHCKELDSTLWFDGFNEEDEEDAVFMKAF